MSDKEDLAKAMNDIKEDMFNDLMDSFVNEFYNKDNTNEIAE